MHLISLVAYFGISMSATSLSSNVYLAFIMSALVETPAMLNIWLMIHWGRKPTIIIALALAGAGCIAGGFTSGALKLFFVLIGTIEHFLEVVLKTCFNKCYNVFDFISNDQMYDVFFLRQVWLFRSI